VIFGGDLRIGADGEEVFLAIAVVADVPAIAAKHTISDGMAVSPPMERRDEHSRRADVVI
jgi:hypothetical protein